MRPLAVLFVVVVATACSMTDNSQVSSTTERVEEGTAPDDAPLASSTTESVDHETGLDVAKLASFVEVRRERSFADLVENLDDIGFEVELFDEDGVPIVELVSRAEVAELMPPEPTTESDWTMLRLLEVVPDAGDRDMVNRQLNLAVTGRCCPILVAAADSETAEAAVAVHELTHQIEFLEVLFPPGEQTLEWFLYATAAFEGNAERIRDEYLDSIGVAPERRAELSPHASGVPEKLLEVFDFPYTYGAEFMRAVDDRGGELAIDEALAAPPVSSKQVMFPAAYFAGDVPVAIDRAPAAAGPIVDRSGTLGAFLLYLATRDSVGEEAAERIVSEWLGDSYVVSSSASQVCLDLRVRMSSPSSASELAEALTNSPARSSVAFQVSVNDDTVDAVRCLDTLD